MDGMDGREDQKSCGDLDQRARVANWSSWAQAGLGLAEPTPYKRMDDEGH